MRSPAALLSLSCAALACTPASTPVSTPVSTTSPPAPAGPATAPRLVVLVVIDQLPAWGLAARRGAYTRGLARLLADGVHFARAEYPYAITFTAPGHAAIGTGASPAVTGVVANAWYRRGAGVERAAEDDPASPVLGLDGARLAKVAGASSAALRVDGLAEALRTATGGRGRSVAIGGKARAACFVAGRRPDVVLWYEPAAVAMTTSVAYGEVPAWAVALGAAHPIAPVLDDVWALDDPAAVAAATGVEDDGPGETDARFPHRLAAMGDPAKALRLTPFLDTIEVDAAIAALAGEQLGADDVPDLLALSLSAHDYVGHQWGQESWEMFDLERRLDRELGRLLDVLDVRVGRGRYAVVLTSDHGATRMPDRTGGPRIPPATIEAAAEAAATALLGDGDWVAAVSSAMIYVRPALAASPRRAEVLAAMAAAVAAVPGVLAVVPMVPGACADQPERARRACLSTVPDESGELLVWPEDGGLVTSFPAGTSHDAPSDDDRTVPVIVYAPGARARTEPAPVSALAVTATVAALLGIPAPASATEPALPW
ncbi:MAG: alkaline phosphatase family protein [Myxococcales bacterium]|nr:alkaline phosphatase family protein [Myxococcales bacterium]